MTTVAEAPIATGKAAVGVRTFAVVAAGQLVSILGLSLTAFALGTWIYQKTESVTSLSLVLLAANLPGILISPLAGAIVDRSDRRRVMLAANCTSAFVELVLWILIVAANTRLGSFFLLVAMILLAAMISAADAFQEPAFTASVPLLVPKRHLSRASGFVQFGQALARILAPWLAGLMLLSVGIGPVLGVDAGTFLFAACTLLLVRIPRPSGSMAAGRARGSLSDDAWAGWAYLRERSGLVALLLLFSAVNFLVAMVSLLYIPLVLSFAQADTAGMVMGISGAGMMAGSIAVMKLGTPKRKVAEIMGLLFVGGVVIALDGAGPSGLLVAACGFAMMFVLPVLQATSQVLWQTKVATDYQGRVFSLSRMLRQATIPAGILSGGWLADHFFRPAMQEGGCLAGWLGPWIGVDRDAA